MRIGNHKVIICMWINLAHMGANVLKAMGAFSGGRNATLPREDGEYKITINTAGAAFELYIKEALTGELGSSYSSSFSWLGNQNFPPDAISREGDAYEIKKHESPKGVIALNSSPPKDMLYRSDPRITGECRNAMGAEAIDLFYVVGHTSGNAVKSVYFVQGKCYAASLYAYGKISIPLADSVKAAIRNAGLESAKTTELGRVARADPLGRASLRVRGMWQIVSPSIAFAEIAPLDTGKAFQAYAIMLESKLLGMGKIPDGVKCSDATAPDPNNPARMLRIKVLEVSW